MSSIKTQHTINIFDPDALYRSLEEYPASYTYVLRYVTFGYSKNIAYDDKVEVVKPYSVYSILVDNKKVTEVFRSSTHDMDREFLEMDTNTGYATLDHHGSNVHICHYATGDGITTIIIAEHKEGYDNVMVLADTIDVGEAMITSNDRYTMTIIVHDIGDTPIEEYKFPHSMMISYVAHNKTLDKYINYVDMVYDQDTVSEFINEYMPEEDIFDTNYDL